MQLEKQKVIQIEDYDNQSVDSVTDELKNQGYEVVTIGSGRRIIDQAPKAGATLLEGEKIILRTEGEMKAPRYDWLVVTRCYEGCKHC